MKVLKIASYVAGAIIMLTPTIASANVTLKDGIDQSLDMHAPLGGTLLAGDIKDSVNSINTDASAEYDSNIQTANFGRRGGFGISYFGGSPYYGGFGGFGGGSAINIGFSSGGFGGFYGGSPFFSNRGFIGSRGFGNRGFVGRRGFGNRGFSSGNRFVGSNRFSGRRGFSGNRGFSRRGFSGNRGFSGRRGFSGNRGFRSSGFRR